jgi:hypothetical protein
MEADVNYLTRRARQEREAATKAADPSARRVHREMANRYEEVLKTLASHRLPIHPVNAA